MKLRSSHQHGGILEPQCYEKADTVYVKYLGSWLYGRLGEGTAFIREEQMYVTTFILNGTRSKVIHTAKGEDGFAVSQAGLPLP